MKYKFLSIEFDHFGNRSYKMFKTIYDFLDTYDIVVDDEHQITPPDNNEFVSIAVVDLSTLEELFHISFEEGGNFDELHNYLVS